MADSAAKGLANAKQAGQLRKDADVQGKRSSIGKRSSSSGLSSSGGSFGSFSSSISGNNVFKNSFTNNINSSSEKNSEAKKRIKREQQLNQAIKAAEKIPVLNKYAKAAKVAKKVEGIKAKRPSLMGFLGKTFGNMIKADQESAIASDSRGEDYDPNDAEGQFTIKLDRRTKIIALAAIGGILLSCIFLCIIMVSSITGGAKESYLASRDYPSEEELAEAYSKDDYNGDSNTSSSGITGNVKSGSTSNIIMVGDSGTVFICSNVYGGGNNCSTAGYKKGNVTFIALGSMGYSWFKDTATPKLKELLNNNPKSTVFIGMGMNGFENPSRYASDYNQLAKDYPDANIVAVSVTPIIDEHVKYMPNFVNDANVVKFNNELKSNLSSDVIYCDVHSKVKGKINDIGDGIHYDAASDRLINQEMMNCIKGSTSSSSNSSFDSLLSKGGISVSALNSKSIKQLVVVDSSGTTASVSFYENSGSGWKLDSNLNADGYVGRQGTSSSPSEGKAATPQGLYAVGDAFYQGSKPDTKLNTFKITSNTYWVDDPNSKYYNKRVEGTSNKDWSSAEHMSEISSYKYGFVIEYNTNPIKKGAGSAIFFHISHNSPTAGCVSVSEDKVLAYLKKLDKSKNPYILII